MFKYGVSMQKTIHSWNLTLADSEKFLAGTQTQTSQTPESDEGSNDDVVYLQIFS